MNWGGRVQKKFFLPGGSGAGGIISWGGRVQNHFSDLTLFFDIQFKNTYNLILLGFKLSSERFLFKNFKTDLTFWHMWFFNFQNLVRSCQHIDGTPCMCTRLDRWRETGIWKNCRPQNLLATSVAAVAPTDISLNDFHRPLEFSTHRFLADTYGREPIWCSIFLTTIVC